MAFCRAGASWISLLISLAMKAWVGWPLLTKPSQCLKRGTKLNLVVKGNRKSPNMFSFRMGSSGKLDNLDFGVGSFITVMLDDFL